MKKPTKLQYIKDWDNFSEEEVLNPKEEIQKDDKKKSDEEEEDEDEEDTEGTKPKSKKEKSIKDKEKDPTEVNEEDDEKEKDKKDTSKEKPKSEELDEKGAEKVFALLNSINPEDLRDAAKKIHKFLANFSETDANKAKEFLKKKEADKK